jgi:hypothetical protein
MFLAWQAPGNTHNRYFRLLIFHRFVSQPYAQSRDWAPPSGGNPLSWQKRASGWNTVAIANI